MEESWSGVTRKQCWQSVGNGKETAIFTATCSVQEELNACDFEDVCPCTFTTWSPKKTSLQCIWEVNGHMFVKPSSTISNLIQYISTLPEYRTSNYVIILIFENENFFVCIGIKEILVLVTESVITVKIMRELFGFLQEQLHCVA